MSVSLGAPVRRPRTKPALSPYRLRNGEILLARDVYGLGRSLQDDRRGTLWTLLGLMDGTRGLPTITRELRKTHPGTDLRAVEAATEKLHRLGVIEDASERRPAALSRAELSRYRPSLDFFSLVSVGSELSSLEAQRRLKGSRVTILGVGAIGGATATALVAAGVGSVRLLDPDRVETSNLNRQTLFRTRDVGRPKAEVAARALRALNPHVQITHGRRRVRRPEQIAPLLTNCDLFVLGADQPHEILLWTNDAAQASGTPWLENSYSGPRGAVSLFVPGRTPCLRCQQHHLLARAVRQRTSGGVNLPSGGRSNAVIAPTAAIAGNYGALQALYFLAGLPAAAEGRLLHLNLWAPDDTRVIRIPFWPACPACGRGVRRGPPRVASRGPAVRRGMNR